MCFSYTIDMAMNEVFVMALVTKFFKCIFLVKFLHFYKLLL